MASIVFGTNDKLTSRLIRWVTKSPWSHVWIEYKSQTWGGHWMAIHSSAKGVVIEPCENVRKRYPKCKTYECRADIGNGLLAIRHYLGADYDYKAVLWNGFLLLVYTFCPVRELFDIVERNNARFSCSELASIILKQAKIRGAHGLDPELMTPGMLERFCSSNDLFWVT